MSVAISYARALVQAVQESKKLSLEAVDLELVEFVRTVEGSVALKKVLYGLAVSKSERVRVVEELCNKMALSPMTKKFLLLLTQKQRMGSISDIQDAFKDLRIESEGALRGKLISADPLSEAEVGEIASSFEKRHKKKIYFDCETNTDLIAGLSITLGGVTYDGSLSSRLRQIRSQMLN